MKEDLVFICEGWCDALSLENELSFLDSRVSFFQKLNSNLELKIVIQKEKLDENTQEPLKSSNIFVNEIADKWNANPNVYKIKYFLLFSTLEKKITGALESFKQKATTEDNNQNTSLSTKINLLTHSSNKIRIRNNNLFCFFF